MHVDTQRNMKQRERSRVLYVVNMLMFKVNASLRCVALLLLPKML